MLNDFVPLAGKPTDVPESREHEPERKLKRSSHLLLEISESLSNFASAHAGTAIFDTAVADQSCTVLSY
ncbi:hypothetical protein J1614_000412 [Plenodomus biglobosus]|nr:hypothetical protein J1614_000412 [Plenodomus biglobosus]